LLSGLLSSNIHLAGRSKPPGPSERGKTPIVRFLDFVRETACGKLLHAQMVMQALATRAFAGTAGISAVAAMHIVTLVVTFHFQKHLS